MPGYDIPMPEMGELREFLETFHSLLRVRFVYEAIHPLVDSPEDEGMRSALRWIAAALTGTPMDRLTFRQHASAGSPPPGKTDLYTAVTDLLTATSYAIDPPCSAHDNTLNGRYCTSALAAALRAASPVDRYRPRLDPELQPVLEEWWGRCVALMPVRGAADAEVEWNTDLLEQLQPPPPVE
ncbi:unnamed protein product [marine sediment metagenome]|uniref:Uncharacterized protein n=1 Tax=marine sediment metagenome TaxID=412755 RepID=X0WTQ5_9ZZZZ